MSINLKPDLVTRIDAEAAADNLSRSGFIVECIHEHFNGTADVQALSLQLEHRSREIALLQEELGYMRLEYSKINEALSQRLLAEAAAKRPWYDKLLGRGRFKQGEQF